MKTISHRFGTTLLLVGALLTTACGKDADDAGEDSPDLTGTWTMPCTLAGTVYEQRQLTFKGTGFTFTNSFNSDAKCADAVSVISGSGSYVLGGSFGGGSAIDYTFVRYTWTFVDDPGLGDEYADACSSTAANGVVDLLGKTCEVDTDAKLTFNSPAYGIITVYGGKLFASTYLTNGATAELRSTQMNATGEGWVKKEETPAALR